MRFHSDDLSPAGPGGEELERGEAEKVLRRVLQSSFHRRELIAMCRRLGLSGAADWSTDRRFPESQVEMRVMGALRRGDLVLVHRVEGGGSGGAKEESPPPPPPATESKEPERTTWIEFQLVGEDDRPIGGVKYRATLPNGSVREGVTRSSGLVRFDGIPEGTWEFTFPELDQDAWEGA